MKVISLTCTHCGAPLEIPAKTRYVTCIYCSSRLEVHRSGNAVYTEVLEQLGQRTERIANDVEILKLQNELEQLDREWQSEMEQYAVRGKDGQYNIPTKWGAILGTIMLTGFAVLWTVSAIAIGAPFFFPLFGLFFVLAAIGTAIGGARRAREYEAAKARYEQRRRELLAKIEGAGGNGAD